MRYQSTDAYGTSDDRVVRVRELLRQGASAKQIAEELGIGTSEGALKYLKRMGLPSPFAVAKNRRALEEKGLSR